MIQPLHLHRKLVRAALVVLTVDRQAALHALPNSLLITVDRIRRCLVSSGAVSSERVLAWGCGTASWPLTITLSDFRRFCCAVFLPTPHAAVQSGCHRRCTQTRLPAVSSCASMRPVRQQQRGSSSTISRHRHCRRRRRHCSACRLPSLFNLPLQTFAPRAQRQSGGPAWPWPRARSARRRQPRRRRSARIRQTCLSGCPTRSALTSWGARSRARRGSWASCAPRLASG